MTVYLGDHGAIELKRKSGAPIGGMLQPGDVSVEKRRFSLGDHDIRGELLTGDQVDIKRVKAGGDDLVLVAGHDYPDWRGYVFVDQIGGIRLFDNFSDSLTGSVEKSVALVSASVDQSIEIQTRGNNYNYLGKVKGYEITTERQSVDITHLGNQFVQQYEAGLISGQGTINCFFEYKQLLCDPSGCAEGTEFAIYLAQLCIRLTQGADFLGRYFIYHPSIDDSLDVAGDEAAVWYECECIVTNCTVNVNTDQAIQATIQFITTDTIRLLTGVPPAYLLQEDSAFLLLERDGGRIMLAGTDV